MNTDLTVGKPWKVLLKYILPLFGSAVFQQLYTIADTVIAGQFAGQTALTAIGASNSIVSILMAIALGANAGCAVLTSRYFGAKEHSKVKSTVFTALIAFSTLSGLLLLVGLFSCRPLLAALKTPAEALTESVTYLNIYYFGLPFLILYNLGTGIFSALGDSRTPFFFLIFSSVTNIGLDLLMVRPLGVAGVAWATFIAQGTACMLTLLFVFLRLRKIQTQQRPVVFSGAILKTLLILAVPVMLQNSFVSVGNLIIQIKINQFANAQGQGITAGFTAAIKLLIFCTTCFMTCANGLTNYVSQNYGAHKYRRIKRGFYATLILSSVVTSAFFAATFFFAQPLIRLFLSAQEDTALALQTGVTFIRIISPFFFLVNIKVVADCTVRGCNGNVGFMVSTFTDLILRVALVFLFTPFLGFAGVGWAWSLGWAIGMGVALLFYFTIPCLRKQNIGRYDEDGQLLPDVSPRTPVLQADATSAFPSAQTDPTDALTVQVAATTDPSDRSSPINDPPPLLQPSVDPHDETPVVCTILFL